MNSLNQIDQSLEGYDSELITLLQAFLLKALQCGDRNRDEQGGNRIAYLCQETNLIEKIDKLTGHGNPKVSENARMLFRDYFEVQNNEDALMMETDEFRIWCTN